MNEITVQINNNKTAKKASITKKEESEHDVTFIHKTFSYSLLSDSVPHKQLDKPTIFVTRSKNTKIKREVFIFRVFGEFIQESMLFSFDHELYISLTSKKLTYCESNRN